MDSPGPTSIRFGAAGWRAIMARDFTFANVRLASQAVAEYLKTELADPNSPIHRRAPAVIIARDCRFLGPQFALAAAEVLTAAGLIPRLCDHATPAPVLALAIRQRKAIGGIYIAAGHNPPEYSGFQFSRHDGAGAPPDVTGPIEAAIVRLQRANWSFPAVVTGTFQARTFDPQPGYFKQIEKLVDFAAIKKARLKIAVDLMFGCGRGYLDALLLRAGAKLTVFHNESDAFFGGHPPDPCAERLAELRQAVRRGQAQLGLATSGDAAHCGVVDRDGACLAPNQVLALAHHLMKTNRGRTRSVVLTAPAQDGILACLMMAELVATERKSLGHILEGLNWEEIDFRDSPAGRQACLQGSSLAVWEVMLVARDYANDAAAVAKHLHWPEAKVQAAFNYALAHPQEIEAALEANDAVDFESLRRMLPQAREFIASARPRKR